MSSFHHSDAASSSCDTALLGASAVLKTETSMNCDDFDDFIWRSDRDVDVDVDDEDEAIPSCVNNEVILVFGIKEVKAFLSFCQYAGGNEDNRMGCCFEWGGRPIIFHSEFDTLSVELIMATLDHRLLKDSNLMSQHQSQQKNRSA
mmetsp:Transcript_14267/g.21971  ORF Transcript_14267/g.21971 Transcript_14267/m.21971 type:complete len:146 (+) Transcript_14267:187-624(+)